MAALEPALTPGLNAVEVVCANPNGIAGGSAWSYTAIKVNTEDEWGAGANVTECQLKAGTNAGSCKGLQPDTQYWVKCEAALAGGSATASGVTRTTT